MKNTENTQVFPNWKMIAKIQKWQKKDFDKLLTDYFENKKEVYSQIKSLKKEDRNFENTILALENCGEEFSDIFFQTYVFEVTHKDKNYRDIISEFKKELADRSVDIEFDKDLYFALKDYIEGNYLTEKNKLDKSFGIGSIKLVEDTFRSYKRMGFDLDKKSQTKFKNNLKKISSLSIDFSKNVNDYKDFILCTKEELKGLPEDVISSFEKVDGKYQVTLAYPHMSPFIKFAESREKRKEISDKNYKKGGKKNLDILTKVVALRDENAKLLSYANHADFVTEERMAKNEKTAREFLIDFMSKLEKRATQEMKDLNVFAKENLEEYKDLKKIEYYDLTFVMNKLKEQKYSFDSAKLKEYFELEHVLTEMFNIFGELFNFKVKEIDAVQKKEKGIVLQDKDVKLFELKDKKDNSVISYLALDLFPRDGKYGHACSAEFVNGGNVKVEDKTLRKVPLNFIICNFPRPQKKTPSLLSVYEVEVLFHEFGHSLHYMMTKAVHVSQAGYQTVWDFVEAPSQFMENFVYQKKYLSKIAKHYITKKALDDKTIEKVIESRKFGNSSNYFRIAISSMFDLDLHSNKISGDSAKYFNSLLKKHFDFDLEPDAIFPAGFEHIMGGYDAGYYSYMWALVYAQDFFSIFKNNIDNKEKLKEIGEKYRKEILEVGSSRDELESAKKFLCRQSNNKAFLKDISA
ncbi:MAG: M3 family metallopeptidase [Candidatus Nomurabacteria bacterium]